jgi:hypothetical protein
LLSSGTNGSTVAGPTNIQFRNFFDYNGNGSNSDDWMPVGLFRPMQSLLLENSYRIVEGLVVDADNGGIGLRNHTVPVGLDLGATWQEDLLWIQPETVCSPNNFTLHFAYGSAQVASYFHGENTQSYLEDNGAFASRNWSIPGPRWDIYGPGSLWNVSGPVPDLIQRAYIAAWWNNGFTAQALNLSGNLHLSAGDQYSKSFSTYTSFISPFSITISNMDGSFFDEAWPYNEWKFLFEFMDRLVKVSDLVPGVQASYDFADQFMQYGNKNIYRELDTLKFLLTSL